MSRRVYIAEVSCVADLTVVLINPPVSLLQAKGWEIGENVDEYFVRELKYCTLSEMLIPNGCK